MIDADAVVLLRRVGMKTSTPAQEAMAGSFQAAGAEGGTSSGKSAPAGKKTTSGRSKSLTRRKSRRW
jgi:hypothetical protein